MFKQKSFAEPGCIGCEAHLDYGLSRYCTGFRNRKRRKPFRKNDPAYKAPKWCPKRKDPCEYRIYSYADERSAVMARLLETDEAGDRELVFPLAHRYRLRAEGKTGLSPKAFYEQANAGDLSSPLPDESIHTRDVVEIDTGLGQFFFYCAASHDFRTAFFDVKRIQTGKTTDETEVS